MSRPRLLDLFCGAGGAAMGYHRAGFDVVGIDIKPQPHYPFAFYHADALALERDRLEGCWHESPRSRLPGRLAACLGDFDAIHASPPCQAYSITRHSHDKRHPDLLGDVRARLVASGLPFVIENVPGAPMLNPLELCGSQFGLEADDDDGERLALRRHRLFESNLFLVPPGDDLCFDVRRRGVMVGGVYGAGPQNRQKASWDGYAHRRSGYTPKAHVRGRLMGIDWMTAAELSQAIPPAYTAWIGEQLMRVLTVAA